MNKWEWQRHSLQCHWLISTSRIGFYSRRGQKRLVFIRLLCLLKAMAYQRCVSLTSLSTHLSRAKPLSIVTPRSYSLYQLAPSITVFSLSYGALKRQSSYFCYLICPSPRRLTIRSVSIRLSQRDGFA